MRRTALLSVAALLAALACASPASAAWTQQRLTDHSSGPNDVALAGNERGDAAIAFQGTRGIALALARPGRPFGALRYVPGGSTGFDPRVAIDEDGNVLVSWLYSDGSQQPAPGTPIYQDCCVRVRLALLRPGTGKFLGPRSVGTPGHNVRFSALSIVDGRVGIAWGYDPERLAARFSTGALRLGPVVRGEGVVVAAVPLATGPIVTFVRDDSTAGANGITDYKWSLWEFRLRPGHPRTVRRLASRSGYFPAIAVATNARGEQAIAWAQQHTNQYDLYAGARSTNGHFAVRRLSQGGSVFGAAVAIARSGAAITAWNDAAGQIFAADRRPGGAAFGNGLAFGPRLANTNIEGLQIGVDLAGHAVIGWIQRRSGGVPTVIGAFRSLDGRRIGAHGLLFANSLGAQATAALDEHGFGRLAWRTGGTVNAGLGRGP
jgi:hypothetical protein